ncbi:MAG TPA: hypothetical protein VFI12_07080 [Thermomicrobiales bacterium]|nr:hypothetical protein [Thermomicrobiales bacterium]
MSEPAVQFYETSALTHEARINHIERQDEWAIIHDRFNDEWEVWADGQLYDVSRSSATARQKLHEAMEERPRSGEYRYKR